MKIVNFYQQIVDIRKFVSSKNIAGLKINSFNLFNILLALETK